MKKHVLLPLLLTAITATAQTTLIEDSFDAYAEGSGMVANDPAHWALWPGGSDQAVSTAFAQSGFNSLACISTSAANGGPGDLLLLLGDKTTGIYDIGWSMYIPTGKGGYFNVQHTEDVTSPLFALEVTFAGGTVIAKGDNTELVGSYPSDEWLDILINVDLDNAGAVLFVNNTPLITWPFDTETDGTATASQLGAIDYFSYGDGTVIGEYYIDDVSYVQQSAGGIGMAEFGSSTIRVFPNPAQDALFVMVEHALSPQASVELLDLTGRSVLLPTIITSRSLRFGVETLPPGVYLVRITDGDRRSVERVVKG